MYAPIETDISERYLERIFRSTDGQTCLVGGWAAYCLVNENFERANGRSYIGSRDIDVGFHIDRNWSEEELRNPDFLKSVRVIEDMGFRAVGFRLLKDFEFETGRELSPEESAKLPLSQIFSLYVDPVVDYIHSKLERSLGFVPIDEPLLSLVFDKGMCSVAGMFGVEVLLPEPHVLLAMKLNSVVNRDKEHKKIKDIADIYAPLWFSGMHIAELKADLFRIYSREKARETVRCFAKDEVDKVSAVIGVGSGEISRVLAEPK